MSDDIISLDDFRARTEKGRENIRTESDVRSFRFNDDATERLQCLKERLGAPHDGAVISVAMEILRLILEEMDASRRVVAQDTKGILREFFIDPRSIFSKTKTPV